MLQVLHVTLDKHYEPLQGGGGVARHIHGLSTELVALGAHVTVSAKTTDKAGLVYDTADAAGLRLLPHIRRVDAVHVHGGRRPEMALVALMARLSRKPVFYTPHAYYAPRIPDGPLRRLAWRLREATKILYNQIFERFLLTQCFHTILLNDFWVSEVRDRLRLPIDRVVVIPNCVRAADLTPIHPATAEKVSGSPSILSVGRLDEVKRLDDVIRALALPRLSDAVFHVVGKGPALGELECLASELGVRDRVVFYGVLDDVTVGRMAARADLFVLPARQEGMPTVIIEMLLRGVPVVSSDIPGSRAIMDIAGAPGLYPLGDIEALADEIAAAPARRLDDAVRARVLENLTWERRAADVLSLYRKAAEEHT